MHSCHHDSFQRCAARGKSVAGTGLGLGWSHFDASEPVPRWLFWRSLSFTLSDRKHLPGWLIEHNTVHQCCVGGWMAGNVAASVFGTAIHRVRSSSMSHTILARHIDAYLQANWLRAHTPSHAVTSTSVAIVRLQRVKVNVVITFSWSVSSERPARGTDHS